MSRLVQLLSSFCWRKKKSNVMDVSVSHLYSWHVKCLLSTSLYNEIEYDMKLHLILNEILPELCCVKNCFTLSATRM